MKVKRNFIKTCVTLNLILFNQVLSSSIFQVPSNDAVNPTSAKICREPTFFSETDDPKHAEPNHHRNHPDLSLESRSDESVVRFDIRQYFDHEEYISGHVQRLLDTEKVYDFKIRLFNGLSSFCFGLAGLTISATSMVSILSSAQLIEYEHGLIITACFSSGSGILWWAGGQLKKAADKHESESKRIKLRLKLPQSLIVPSISIEIDPPRLNNTMNELSPTNKSLNKSVHR